MGWYCPKCGSPVRLTDGVWRCDGGLEFSINLGKRLAAAYETASRPGRTRDRSPAVGVLFCPACACCLDQNGLCPTCGQSFKEFLFEMIEFHPHPDRAGGWF